MHKALHGALGETPVACAALRLQQLQRLAVIEVCQLLYSS